MAAIVLPVTIAAQTAGDLPRSTPAQEGVEPKAVTNFLNTLQAVPATEVHHVMVLRHGKVIAEMHPSPFRAQDAHTLYSESKTFVAMAVGIAIGENRLRLTDRVATFFPGELPDSVSANLASMTVRDLLMMASGIKPDWEMRNTSDDWERVWLAKPVSTPGKKFRYDSLCTFMLSAIVSRVTGTTVLDYLREHVFGPLGIKQAEWELSPSGVNTGGWGLRLQAESQAKFGQLLLQGGMWNGRQLIPKWWIEEASKKQIQTYAKVDPPTDKNRGYGYQMWQCLHAGAYRADGAYGQFIVVIPDQDMVVVINGVSAHTDKELAAIWQQLLLGVKAQPLATGSGQKALEAVEQRASLPAQGIKSHGQVKPAQYRFTTSKGVLSIGLGEQLTYSFDGRTITAAHGQWNYETLKQAPPYSITPRDRLKGLDPRFTTASQWRYQDKDKNDLAITTYWVDFISGETIKVNFTAPGKAHVVIKRNYDTKPLVDEIVAY